MRTPTIVLTYLCLFKRVKSWKNVEMTRDFMSESCSKSMPNVPLVEQIIGENKKFQDQQIDIQ